MSYMPNILCNINASGGGGYCPITEVAKLPCRVLKLNNECNYWTLTGRCRGISGMNDYYKEIHSDAQIGMVFA